MNVQQTLSSGTKETGAVSSAWDRLSNLLYVQYYVLMFVLYILGTSPEMAGFVTDAVWLRRILFVASFITTVYCVYRVIQNRKMAIRCMELMPNWMFDIMDRLPHWVNRLMGHTSMRVMMVAMDVMVAWMCVEYVRITLNTSG